MHKTSRMTNGGVKIDQLTISFIYNINFDQVRKHEEFINHKEIKYIHELIFYAVLDFLFVLLDTHIAHKDIFSFMNGSSMLI